MRSGARAAAMLLWLVAYGAPASAAPAPTRPAQDPGTEQQQQDQDDSRITDEVIPLATDLPVRPRPLLELGATFLGSGRIDPGIEVPGGAVWQPAFLLFGTLRSSAGLLDDETVRTRQWANRLDLFGNLYLTPTERIVVGIRPLDQETELGRRAFTGYTSLTPDPDGRSGFESHLNLRLDTVQSLFFEGDLLELLPFLDRADRRPLDLGFSVGRQAVTFQEGLLIDDVIDGVGLTRNNLKPARMSNLRLTGLFAWAGVNRNAASSGGAALNPIGRSSRLAGLFTEIDWRATTMALDLIWVSGSDGDVSTTDAGFPTRAGLYGGLSFVQRIGRLNTAFRAVGSIPTGSLDPGDHTPDSTFGDPASRGGLLFTEVSWTPHHSDDLLYVNTFAALGRYRAAALDPTVPGPLARAGILYAGAGIGNFGAALSPMAHDVVGFAAGRQSFYSGTRAQLLVEAGGRMATGACITDGCDPHAIALGARYQRAFGRRWVFVADAFVAYDRLRHAVAEGAGRVRNGTRLELLVKF